MKRKGENRLPRIRNEAHGESFAGYSHHEGRWARHEHHKAYQNLRPAFFRAMTMRMMLKSTPPGA